MKSFIIPEYQVSIGLPFFFCKLPEWLNEEKGFSVFNGKKVVRKTSQKSANDTSHEVHTTFSIFDALKDFAAKRSIEFVEKLKLDFIERVAQG